MKPIGLVFLLLQPAFAQDPSVYVNNSSVEASRAMEKVAGRDPEKLQTEVEMSEWASARLAWVALRRLQGREAEALKIFEGCGKICEKYGSGAEWKAARAWGCEKKREAKPCLSSSSNPSDKKTKAQKPSL